MKNITLTQINVFLTVAQTGNLSETAKLLYMTQPGVSKLINRFESELDVNVFMRSNKGVSLTKDGEYLYTELKPLYEKMCCVLQNVHDFDEKQHNIIRIGCHNSYGNVINLEKYINKFNITHPNINVIYEMYEFRQLREKLLDGSIDFAYAATVGLADLPETIIKNVEPLDVYLCMSRNHPLANYEHFSDIPPQLLNKEIFYFVSKDDTQTNSNNEMERCNMLGFTPREIRYLSNFSSVVMYIIQGNGMSLLGNFDETPYRTMIKSYYTGKWPNPGYIALAWRENDISDTAMQFINSIPECK